MIEAMRQYENAVFCNVHRFPEVHHCLPRKIFEREGTAKSPPEYFTGLGTYLVTADLLAATAEIVRGLLTVSRSLRYSFGSTGKTW
jgi:hypothetical protein